MRTLTSILGAVGVALSALVLAPGAQAGPVSEQPSRDRPQYLGESANVFAIEQVGSRVVVAGKAITSIEQGDGQVVAGGNLTATGAADPSHVTWRAGASGTWDSLLGLNPHAFLAGGSGGVSSYSFGDGLTWHADVPGNVRSLERVPGTGIVIAGGQQLVALNVYTGRRVDYPTPVLAGGERCGTRADEADSQPSGRLYVLSGCFGSVAGKPREGLAVLRMGQHRMGVTDWHPPQAHPCSERRPVWVLGIDFTPDGSKWAAATTGGFNHGWCDSALMFTAATGRLLWQDSTPRDSVTDVLAESDRTVVQGHYKAIGTSEATLKSRFGIAVVSTATGAVLPWKSDKCRGIGGSATERVAGGIAVGFDCAKWGNTEGINPDPSPTFDLARYAYLGDL